MANWVVQTSKSGEETGEAPSPDTSGGAGSLKNKTIVVDPGHGGKDSGTIGYSGKFEKNVTIKTANAGPKIAGGRCKRVYHQTG